MAKLLAGMTAKFEIKKLMKINRMNRNFGNDDRLDMLYIQIVVSCDLSNEALKGSGGRPLAV